MTEFSRRHRTCPAAFPGKGEMLIRDAGLDRIETDCLALARCFLALVNDPEATHRRQAVEDAANRFGAAHGPEVACAMSGVLGAIRQSRNAAFVFGNPACPDCARILTEHERRLTGTLAALRRARKSAAHVQAMLLCEGNPPGAVLDRMGDLAARLPPPGKPERMSKAWTGH